MSFRSNKRYSKTNMNIASSRYALFLKYNDSDRFKLKGYFATADEAVKKFYTMKYKMGHSSEFQEALSDDFRVKLIEQSYKETEVSVASIKEIEMVLPELKGFFR